MTYHRRKHLHSYKQHRKLTQVSIEDNAEAERMVTILMGDKVEPRKDYIFMYADFNKKDDFKPVSAEGGKE